MQLSDDEPEQPDDVLCVCCGTTEPGAFSHRMLKRRGRHGERTRRCLVCVEKDAQPDKQVAVSCACGATIDPGDPCCAACADVTHDKQRKKLLKALRQVEELKQRLGDGEQLEQTQRDKIARELEMRAQLEQLQNPGTADAIRATLVPVTKRKQDGSGSHDAARGAERLGKQAVTSAPSGLQTRFEIRAAKKQRKSEKKQYLASARSHSEQEPSLVEQRE
jgi:hypothetical protein